MPISLGGVELPVPTGALCAWIERNLPVAEAFPWAASSWPGPTLDARTPGVPAARMPATLEVNRFVWPQGASRFAHGAFLAAAREAEQVRAVANGRDGRSSIPIPLVLASPGQPAGEVLSVSVNLLRVVPLHSLATTNGGTPTADDDFRANNPVLLVVVDQRYYWQSAPCPDLGILPYGSYNPNAPADSAEDLPDGPTPPPPSWAACIKKLGAAVGATIDHDPVPAEYLSPDPALNLAGMPAGPALDAVLFNCGLRLVANYDGSFYAQSAPTAIAARKADDESGAGRARALRAGGDAFADEL